MKKALVLACLVSVFAVSSFAQSAPARTPAEAGARLVAERDAAWHREHPGGAMVKEPMVAHNDNAMHAHHAKHVKHGMHVKHTKHTTHVKHGKHKVKKAE